MKSLSRVWIFSTAWTAAYQAPPSMGSSRQEYWSGVPLPSPAVQWHEFNPWVRKIPWRREQQHTPVFLPGKLHGQRSLQGCSPQRVRHDLVTKQKRKKTERKLLWNLSLQPNLSQCQDLISSFFFYHLQVSPAFCWIFKWLPLPSGENLASIFRDSQNPLCI